MGSGSAREKFGEPGAWTLGGKAVALLALGLAFPAASQAVTVVNHHHTGQGDPSGYSGRGLRIISDRAVNDYRVDIDDGTIIIRDLSRQAIHSSLPECSATAANELTCAPSRAFSDRGVVLIALLLDGADRFSPGLGEAGCGREPLALTSETSLATGAQVWGSANPDSIAGLTGDGASAPGGKIYGCGGPDRFSIAGHDARIWGGVGADRLKALGRRAVALGQRGADRLNDDGGPERLVGGLARDHVISGRGHDILLGGPGRDHLEAGWRYKGSCRGPGPGTCTKSPTESDSLNCGPGRDRALAGHDSRLRHCERKTWLPRPT